MKSKSFLSLLMVLCILVSFSSPVMAASGNSDEIILRICNWEEYIDEGEWEEDEVIDLESGDVFGENPMIDDFADWYYETYGK